MHYRLNSFSGIAATLLLSLTPILQLPVVTLSASTVSAQSQVVQKPAAEAAEWQEFVSTKGGFSILMPGKPTEQIQPAKPGDVPGNTHLFLSERGAIAYVVGYKDGPADARKLSPDWIEKTLNAGRNGVVGKGRLLGEKAALLNGHPGKEFEFKSADGLIGKARIYWVQQRFYILLVGAPTQAILSQEKDKFFNSFKLLSGSTQGTSRISLQAEETHDREAEVDRLNDNNFHQLNQEQLQNAVATLQQALAVRKKANDRVGEANTLNRISSAYHYLGQHPQALASRQQALKIFQEIGNRTGEALTLWYIGEFYRVQDDYPQAVKFYEQALPILRQIGDRGTEYATLNNLARVYSDLGQHPKALEIDQQALTVARARGDRAGENNSLISIGAGYVRLKQFPKALEFLQQALAVAKAAGDRVREGTTLDEIGQVYDGLGQYPKALEVYQKALAIAKEGGYRELEAEGLNHIGGVYRVLGQYSKAMEFFQQALTIARKMDDHAREEVNLNSIGLTYDEQGQYAQALESFQQSLVISRELRKRKREGIALGNIGLVHSHLGQDLRALEFYQQALAIGRETNDLENEGRVLNNIGGTYSALGQHSKALEYYQQALPMLRRIGDRNFEGVTLSNMGYSLFQTGKLLEAEKTLEAGIEVLESLRPGLSDTSKVALVDTQINPYRFLQQVLIAQNKPDKALEIAERSRARVFAERLATRLATDSAQQSKLVPPNLEHIKQIAQQQNATLVEYSIVSDPVLVQGKEVDWQQSELYIWVIKPTGEVAFRKTDLKPLWQQKTSLASLVIDSRTAIGARGREAGVAVVPTTDGIRRNRERQTKQLQQLHQLLITPIADLLPTDPNARVIFLPQQTLFLVPFPALQDANGTYLIEKHTLLTAPSIQLLDLTRQAKGKGQPAQGNATQTLSPLASRLSPALIVGNPTMPNVAIQPGDPAKPLANLPGAEEEATAIAKLLNTQAIIGKQATKTSILKQIANARLIHLATHGLLDDFIGEGVPGAIALAPNGTGERNDGLLMASEILAMNLKAELVVLSACDTGRGNITSDGIVGLSRSLILAGVPSIVVSLWQVPDAPTASLMTEFYKNLQKTPDKAQALRQAMLTTKQKHRDPADWAAFTLIGEAD